MVQEMKSLNNYITEKFQVSVDNIKNITYVYHPKDKDELIECIKEKIEKEGLGTGENPLDLNDIDTSNITDMSFLFEATDGKLKDLSKTGYFDVSDWDVSNVENMNSMFASSDFDGDLSDWNVSKVKRMICMFYESKFTGNNGDISGWDVSNVKTMYCMFYGSKFKNKNGDISRWDVSNVETMHEMFVDCPLEFNTPRWYYE